MKAKKVRKKGKISLSKYFKKFKENERVAVVSETGIPSGFPDRIIGKCGEVIGARGTHMLIKLNDGNKTKTFIIHPIHLRKLK